LSRLSATALPDINKKIYPILIQGYTESGETELYLYLFSDKYAVLDKVLLNDYITTSRGGKNGLTVGHIYFSIDEKYQITVWQRFNNESIEIKRYQITEAGRFLEIPMDTPCFTEFTANDNLSHS